MRRYRVVVVEDSAVVRERLVIMLAGTEGLCVVGAMDTSRESTRDMCCLDPDAVVLGTRAGDPAILSLLLAIKEDRPETFIIALSNAPCTVCREKFLAAGADLFLDKSCEFDRIGPALAQASVQAHREDRDDPRDGIIGPSPHDEYGIIGPSPHDEYGIVGPSPHQRAGTTLPEPNRPTNGLAPSSKGERE